MIMGRVGMAQRHMMREAVIHQGPAVLMGLAAKLQRIHVVLAAAADSWAAGKIRAAPALALKGA